MADWFAHRLDAEEIAGQRIKSTGKLHIVRAVTKPRRGFLVIETKRHAPPVPIEEIKLGEKKLVGTIDCTPTWAETLKRCLAILEDGSWGARAIAEDELGRMARLADAYVALQKKKGVAA